MIPCFLPLTIPNHGHIRRSARVCALPPSSQNVISQRKFEITEYKKSTNDESMLIPVKTFVVSENAQADIRSINPSQQEQNRFQPFDIIQYLILPRGYPASVSPDYIQFVVWNVLRHITASSYAVLGTSQMLKALGVGSATASNLSATLNWVLKDGLGLSSKLLLASQFAPLVDRNPKRFRLLGDFVMTVGPIMELLTPLFPAHFLLFASLGTLFKKGADVATGPAYRVFLNHFAISKNIGDVSSRAESQIVIGNLVGTGLGIGISFLVKDNLEQAFEAYGVLAVLHVLCTYFSVKDIALRTLNWNRLDVLLGQFVKEGTILTTTQVCQREGFVMGNKDSTRKRIALGSEANAGSISYELVTLFRTERYFLFVDDHDIIRIIFKPNRTNQDILLSLLQAHKLLQYLTESQTSRTVGSGSELHFIRETLQWATERIDLLTSGLQSLGWEIEKILVDTGKYVYQIDDPISARSN
mmetsp:Transcript_1740/g.2981  ORF Transcript_1740/g.2981 Transcript_1740/m.2981 type:complete len:472 (-) Transcript_1740:221-1636(-)